MSGEIEQSNFQPENSKPKHKPTTGFWAGAGLMSVSAVTIFTGLGFEISGLIENDPQKVDTGAKLMIAGGSGFVVGLGGGIFSELRRDSQQKDPTSVRRTNTDQLPDNE